MRRSADDGNDELRYSHADCSDQEQTPASQSLDQVQARDGGHKGHDVDNKGNYERGLESGGLEERGPIIENETD